jgi:hypothetical protein
MEFELDNGSVTGTPVTAAPPLPPSSDWRMPAVPASLLHDALQGAGEEPS